MRVRTICISIEEICEGHGAVDDCNPSISSLYMYPPGHMVRAKQGLYSELLNQEALFPPV